MYYACWPLSYSQKLTRKINHLLCDNTVMDNKLCLASLLPYITSLLKSLPPPPVEQDTPDELVSHALADSKDKLSLKNHKSQWEYLLKNEIFLLAVCCCGCFLISTYWLRHLCPGNEKNGPSKEGGDICVAVMRPVMLGTHEFGHMYLCIKSSTLAKETNV